MVYRHFTLQFNIVLHYSLSPFYAIVYHRFTQQPTTVLVCHRFTLQFITVLHYSLSPFYTIVYQCFTLQFITILHYSLSLFYTMVYHHFTLQFITIHLVWDIFNGQSTQTALLFAQTSLTLKTGIDEIGRSGDRTVSSFKCECLNRDEAKMFRDRTALRIIALITFLVSMVSRDFIFATQNLPQTRNFHYHWNTL